MLEINHFLFSIYLGTYGDVNINVFFNKFILSLSYLLLVTTNPVYYDTFDAYKGKKLNAKPAFATLEHGVLRKNFFKGLTNGRIRLSLKYQKNAKVYNANNSSTRCSKKYIKFPNHYLLISHKIFSLEASHLARLIKNKLTIDIELNPGPTSADSIALKLKIITLNCRGLGNVDKFRLLLNKLNKFMTKHNIIALLQETMIVDESYVKMAWRGNSIVTPGLGNSKGCKTLTNSDVAIDHVHHIGNRGHYFTYCHNNEDPILVMNIYAPNGFNEDKFEFFSNIFDNINAYDCDVIVGGDFNVTLRDSDRHNRGTTPREIDLARYINESTEHLGLIDVWSGKSGYTWRKGKTMSKLDRIYTRLSNYVMCELNTDWTLTSTDHAAVITTFKHNIKERHKSSHIKLDNEILKNPEMLLELRQYVIEQLSDETVHGFNPHTKLEFAKMSIRTKALDLMAKLRKEENMLLKELNEDIKTNTKLLATHRDPNFQNILQRELDLATEKRNDILSKQGIKLATLAKTKWYNEGEKSNKYFLNLLKRQAAKSEMNS